MKRNQHEMQTHETNTTHKNAKRIRNIKGQHYNEMSIDDAKRKCRDETNTTCPDTKLK